MKLAKAYSKYGASMGRDSDPLDHLVVCPETNRWEAIP
jgi:hypothetical protein